MPHFKARLIRTVTHFAEIDLGEHDTEADADEYARQLAEDMNDPHAPAVAVAVAWEHDDEQFECEEVWEQGQT